MALRCFVKKGVAGVAVGLLYMLTYLYSRQYGRRRRPAAVHLSFSGYVSVIVYS